MELVGKLAYGFELRGQRAIQFGDLPRKRVGFDAPKLLSRPYRVHFKIRHRRHFFAARFSVML